MYVYITPSNYTVIFEYILINYIIYCILIIYTRVYEYNSRILPFCIIAFINYKFIIHPYLRIRNTKIQ